MRFRRARKEDLVDIVRMIANDKLGKKREDLTDPLPHTYYNAFQNINDDDNQELIIIENDLSEIIGTLQLSFIRYLTYQGGIRAQIEAVRIRDDQRGKGLGEELIKWAITRAKEKGAHLVQLTTDKQRPEALKFYEKLGFRATHEGMKLHL
ncbi:MAG: GNAT family N-acetyltransferase [Flavobacteriaceae bacterium]|nr:GNAT family N-acetyltransferase [Flavobacteriaceae bacterium]